MLVKSKQNCMVRKKDEDTDAMLYATVGLHWLPVRDRIVFKLLFITYKIRHGHASAYLADFIITDYTPARTLCSTSQNLLEFPSNHEVATATGKLLIFRLLSFNVIKKNIVVRRM